MKNSIYSIYTDCISGLFIQLVIAYSGLPGIMYKIPGKTL